MTVLFALYSGNYFTSEVRAFESEMVEQLLEDPSSTASDLRRHLLSASEEWGTRLLDSGPGASSPVALAVRHGRADLARVLLREFGFEVRVD